MLIRDLQVDVFYDCLHYYKAVSDSHFLNVVSYEESLAAKKVMGQEVEDLGVFILPDTGISPSTRFETFLISQL